MENLEIQATNSTPLIRFNADTGKLLMAGRSIPEDPGVFYDRVMSWLEKYFSDTNLETEMEFELEYANSGSSKYILELLKDLKQYESSGKVIRVVWKFELDDESIEELGELYKSTIDLPFELIAVEGEDEEEES